MDGGIVKKAVAAVAIQEVRAKLCLLLQMYNLVPILWQMCLRML